MKITNKRISTSTIFVIGICISITIFAMESPEQRQEEIRLDELRRQQPQPQPRSQDQKVLVNQLEALRSLQKKQQQKQPLNQQQLQELQKLQTQFQQLQQFQPQKYQQVQQQYQQRQNQKNRKKLKKTQPKEKKQPKQQLKQQLKQQQDKWHESTVQLQPALAMKQILLDQRENDIQRLQKQLKSPFHKLVHLHEELERLQIPIDLYLLEPSQELENQARQLQKHPTEEQQIQQDQIQQLELKKIQELLEEQLVQQQEITKEEGEDEACAICMEDQNMGPIPCKNKHNDLICNSCLAKIKNSNNLCPICREPLVN